MGYDYDLPSTKHTPRWHVERAFAETGETWADVEYMASNGSLDEYPDRGDRNYTIWTARYVYFPAQYDGYYWTARVPRHPVDVATEPVGI